MCDLYDKIIIAKCLSTRLLIGQYSQFAFLCMYIHHTLIAWAQLLWSRPQTTSHVVLVRPGGDRRVKKIVQEPKWGTGSPSMIVLESEDRNEETKRVRQRRESDRYSHGTLLTF